MSVQSGTAVFKAYESELSWAAGISKKAAKYSYHHREFLLQSRLVMFKLFKYWGHLWLSVLRIEKDPFFQHTALTNPARTWMVITAASVTHQSLMVLKSAHDAQWMSYADNWPPIMMNDSVSKCAFISAPLRSSWVLKPSTPPSLHYCHRQQHMCHIGFSGVTK